MPFICFSFHPSGPEWTQEAKHTGLQEVLEYFLSRLSPAAVFSPLILLGTFFYASNLQSTTLVQRASPFSDHQTLARTNWLMYVQDPLYPWVSCWVCVPLINRFQNSGNLLSLCFTFCFVFWIFFLSYALIIIKIITQQKKKAGWIWHAVTEGRTHSGDKTWQAAAIKTGSTFKTWHFSGKCWKAVFCLFVCSCFFF